tara:strand:+ start:2237 stop:3106 length:870 start_codon:yes stop_codon:yes gene_type:complete
MATSKRPGFQREFTNTSLTEIGLAENVIYNTYGDRVSVEAKGKNLEKFGSNFTVGNTYETVGQFQGTVANETYVTTNIIDSVVSGDAADTTQTVTIEGHTVDAVGNLTFVVQDAELNGLTEVTLTTPLARTSRAFIKASGTYAAPVTQTIGTVYIYDNTDGITAGVPNTPEATKLLILPEDNQSEKASTSTSSTEYWIVSFFGASVGVSGGSAARVTFRLELRDVYNGGLWRPAYRDIVLDVGQNGDANVRRPYLIIPKNHDVRVKAKTNANTASVFAEAAGYLAKIIT